MRNHPFRTPLSRFSDRGFSTRSEILFQYRFWVPVKFQCAVVGLGRLFFGVPCDALVLVGPSFGLFLTIEELPSGSKGLLPVRNTARQAHSGRTYISYHSETFVRQSCRDSSLEPIFWSPTCSASSFQGLHLLESHGNTLIPTATVVFESHTQCHSLPLDFTLIKPHPSLH